MLLRHGRRGEEKNVMADKEKKKKVVKQARKPSDRSSITICYSGKPWLSMTSHILSRAIQQTVERAGAFFLFQASRTCGSKQMMARPLILAQCNWKSAATTSKPDV
jgi:hypothetical protein